MSGLKENIHKSWGPIRADGQTVRVPSRPSIATGLRGLDRQLIGRPESYNVRPIADRASPIQMLMNRHDVARQTLTPACLSDLKHAALHHHRVVLIDPAFMVQAEHPVA